ncbi:hypothetical protein BHE74_00032996 [Ensete ventricosum]|nr:hypothetical protein BHE74_00032996 [Ensete ventricosum]RZR84794.1 hypothetical protein BHM03_00011675 [Ensete ventricosum]
MLYFIVKQRSQLEKMISSYDFTERGWRLGISGSRVKTMRLDNIAIVVTHFTEYQPFNNEERRGCCTQWDVVETYCCLTGRRKLGLDKRI